MQQSRFVKAAAVGGVGAAHACEAGFEDML